MASATRPVWISCALAAGGVAAMSAAEPERVVNLSYFIGELAPHTAFKLDIQGMDNCFEAARRCGVRRTSAPKTARRQSKPVGEH